MIEKTLQEFPFFSRLSKKELESITARWPRRNFRAGENILQQGEPCTEAHLLVEGTVEVVTNSSTGMQAHIIFHRAPSLFGIIELWREQPYLGTVKALEPCSTLVLDKAAYLKFLHSNHQACITIIQFLSDQIFQNGVDSRVKLFGSAEQWLSRYFISHAFSYGEERQGGVFLKMTVNKSHIARALGLSRRHVIRAFSKLEKDKMIEVHAGQLFIPNIKVLTSFADSAWKVKERRKFNR